MNNLKHTKNIILVIFLALFTSLFYGCNSKPLTVNDFLEKNYTDLDTSSDKSLSDFKILDKDIAKNDVIFTGEWHAISKNSDIQLALIKYMNQHYNINYLLFEVSYSDSCYFNQYLKSGDENNLKIVFDSIKGTLLWSKEYYNFFIELRKYNTTLPQNKRIVIIGIDIEHQVGIANKYLFSLIPDTAALSEIKSNIDSIKEYTQSHNITNKDVNNVEFKTIIQNLQINIKKYPSIYKEYLGDNSFAFSIVVDNIINSINYYAPNAKYSRGIREQGMYSNFLRIYKHLPVGKYYGEFGMAHVYQKIPQDSNYPIEYSNLAMYLNSNNSPVKGKVLSIAYGYENCYYRESGKGYSEQPAIPTIKDMDVIEKYCKTDITIFRLTGANSPFNNKVYFVQGATGQNTTDYFQYLILIKNSKGTIPLGK